MLPHGDIANVALNDLLAINQIGIGDKLHVYNFPAAFGNLLGGFLHPIRKREVCIGGDHGRVRPHRAHGLVEGERGQCGKFLTCKYHGWTYHLDGRNRSISAAETFAPFDRQQFGLKPIELEVWMGLVFVRFRAGEPAVAERMAPYAAELAHYRIEQMVPLGELWHRDLDIDWKNVVENYVEDYHFPMGHPGLSALMEADYDREVGPGGIIRLKKKQSKRKDYYEYHRSNEQTGRRRPAPSPAPLLAATPRRRWARH